METKNYKISIPGLSINSRVYGPEDGQPILGLHGWLDNAGTFDLLAPLLPSLRIVSVDFPGHGFSDHLPLSAPYDHTSRLLQMIQVADALGWEKFGILGHSMGGVIGLFMAGTFPERITKIGVIDSTPFFAWQKKLGHSDLIADNCRWYYQKSKEIVNPHTIYTSYEEAAQKRAVTFTPMKEKSSLTLAKAGMIAVPGGYSWTFDLRLLLPNLSALNENIVRAAMNNINCPICVIVGKNGMVAIDPNYRQHFPQTNNLEIHEIEGGHHLHLDEPEAVAKILNRFWR